MKNDPTIEDQLLDAVPQSFRAPRPSISILDPRFHYRDSANTDIEESIDRQRRRTPRQTSTFVGSVSDYEEHYRAPALRPLPENGSRLSLLDRFSDWIPAAISVLAVLLLLAALHFGWIVPGSLFERLP